MVLYRSHPYFYRRVDFFSLVEAAADGAFDVAPC